MKYEKNVLLVLLLLISSMKLAGSVSPGFGEVDDSLVIQMKDEIFPSAKAVYMFKRSSVRVEGEYIIIDVFNRIKIYNDDFEYLGNIEIPVRSYGRKEVKVYDIQAVSFNEENGIIKRSELAQGDIYKQELGENVQAYKFAVPQVRSRSVVDVRYSYRAPLGYAIPTFYFQEDAPVKNARLEIEAPEYIEFQMVASGLAYFDELEPEVRSSSLEVQYRETSNVVSTTSSYSASATSGSVSVLEKVKQPNSVLQENGRNSALSLSKEGYSDQIRHVRRIFEGKNIPSYSVDDYVLNRDDFRTGVRFELKSISYPGRKVLSFSKDWNTLARELRSEKLIAKNLTKPVRKSLPKLNLDSAENLEAKVKAVYDLIRTNYEWDGKFGISRNDTKFSTIINEKRGNVADVNGLLINQLNRYGVNAKPVYIKSRNRGLLNTAIPNYYDLDYMLAYVQIDGKEVLLDATDPLIAYTMLPNRSASLNGLLIDENGGSIVIMKNPNKRGVVNSASYVIEDSDNLVVKGDLILKGSAAYDYRKENLLALQNENYKTSNIEVLNASGVEDIQKDVKIKYSQSISDVLVRIDDDIIINATIGYGIKSNPLTNEHRDHPMFYDESVYERHVLRVNIPEGYCVDTKPDNINLSVENNDASFRYNTKEVDGILLIDYSFRMSAVYFEATNYENLKEFYRRIVEKTKEKVVLTKKT